MKNKIVLLVAFFLIQLVGLAQNVMEQQPAMADTFRSEGKIYVVISVMSIIFICLIAYLVYIDLKLKKLEKK